MPSPHPELDAILSSLTARERQIVDYVAAGRANKVIAIDLGISLRTVEAHRARIFTKLNARNAMQLACRLCEHGRSGASPVPGAHWDGGGAGMTGPRSVAVPAPRGAGAPVLHEPVSTYAPCEAGPPAFDPDASCGAGSE